MRINLLSAGIVFGFLVFCRSGSVDAQLIKLKVGYSAISEVDMPVWVAKETRIFEKNGLDVQIIYFTGGTTAVLAEKTWELLTEGSLLPKKQYPTIDGLKFILAPLAEKDARARAAKPEDFIDVIFVKELDQSGYIDGLYKKK